MSTTDVGAVHSTVSGIINADIKREKKTTVEEAEELLPSEHVSKEITREPEQKQETASAKSSKVSTAINQTVELTGAQYSDRNDQVPQEVKKQQQCQPKKRKDEYHQNIAKIEKALPEKEQAQRRRIRHAQQQHAKINSSVTIPALFDIANVLRMQTCEHKYEEYIPQETNQKDSDDNQNPHNMTQGRSTATNSSNENVQGSEEKTAITRVKTAVQHTAPLGELGMIGGIVAIFGCDPYLLKNVIVQNAASICPLVMMENTLNGNTQINVNKVPWPYVESISEKNYNILTRNLFNLLMQSSGQDLSNSEAKFESWKSNNETGKPGRVGTTKQGNRKFATCPICHYSFLKLITDTKTERSKIQMCVCAAGTIAINTLLDPTNTVVGEISHSPAVKKLMSMYRYNEDTRKGLNAAYKQHSTQALVCVNEVDTKLAPQSMMLIKLNTRDGMNVNAQKLERVRERMKNNSTPELQRLLSDLQELADNPTMFSFPWGFGYKLHPHSLGGNHALPSTDQHYQQIGDNGYYTEDDNDSIHTNNLTDAEEFEMWRRRKGTDPKGELTESEKAEAQRIAQDDQKVQNSKHARAFGIEVNTLFKEVSAKCGSLFKPEISLTAEEAIEEKAKLAKNPYTQTFIGKAAWYNELENAIAGQHNLESLNTISAKVFDEPSEHETTYRSFSIEKLVHTLSNNLYSSLITEDKQIKGFFVDSSPLMLRAYPDAKPQAISNNNRKQNYQYYQQNNRTLYNNKSLEEVKVGEDSKMDVVNDDDDDDDDDDDELSDITGDKSDYDDDDDDNGNCKPIPLEQLKENNAMKQSREMSEDEDEKYDETNTTSKLIENKAVSGTHKRTKNKGGKPTNEMQEMQP